MFGLGGPWELFIILVIIAMFFGVGRLPEVFGSIGKGIKEFRTAAAGDDDKPSGEATADHSET